VDGIKHLRGPALPVLLLALLACLTAIDGLWLAFGHFHVDGGAFFGLGLLAASLLMAARFYRTVRPDPRIAAMLFGAGFLCLFSSGASILNYLLLTKAGARIDIVLADLDRAMGLDWPGLMRWMGQHPGLNAAARIVYSSTLPQVALSAIVLAGIEPDRVYRFCLALALSALLCITIWSFVPSFGAFSVYALPDAKMDLALNSAYAQELLRLLREGPGLISPHNAKGLIGFPSYHAVLALLVCWYLRDVKFLRWPVLGLNLAVILATPVQGGHHFIDVFASFPVAALSIFAAARLAKTAKVLEPVNKESTAAESLPQALATRKL
jgi:hypothetical protein